jgi:hypothetical protein
MEYKDETDFDVMMRLCVFFHEKKKYTLNGYSMFPILFDQEKNALKLFSRTLYKIEEKEPWFHPLVSDMKVKIEKEYKKEVNSIYLNFFSYSGKEEEEEERKEKYNTYEGNGSYIFLTGNDRNIVFKNIITEEIKTVLMEDGDLFYANIDFLKLWNFSISRVEKLEDESLFVIFFC